MVHFVCISKLTWYISQLIKQLVTIPFFEIVIEHCLDAYAYPHPIVPIKLLKRV